VTPQTPDDHVFVAPGEQAERPAELAAPDEDQTAAMSAGSAGVCKQAGNPRKAPDPGISSTVAASPTRVAASKTGGIRQREFASPEMCRRQMKASNRNQQPAWIW